MYLLNLAIKHLALIFFAFLFTACSSIEIKKPSDDQKYLLSPNKLIAVHKGCGSVRQKTFKAWLNKGDSDEQEITSFFSYSNDTWISNNISLPITRNMFTAYADVSTSGFCYERKSTDHQEMYVIPLPTPIKIMALGDSITRGCCLEDQECDIGYRHYLNTKLVSEGYNIEFVGSQRHPSNLCSDANTPTNFDRDHEGYYNKTTQWLSDNVATKLQLNSPDIVLLHIGTNDLRNGSSDDIPEFVENVRKTLQTIFSFAVNNNKRIVIFVALIIDQKPSNPLVSQYNSALAAMVRERIDQYPPLILLNMQTGAGLDYQVYISDNFQPYQLHPNTSGYIKMAELWYRTLVSVIGPP